ncbi:MAG: phenylalanine--tRNA ligase subunit beta [Verrucomicrobiota bacterium]
MKVSLNWLRELVDFQQDANALSALLTNAGVEVEGVETRGVSIDKVVVAQILSSEQHPNADRLSVCKVEDGSGEPRQIVCGAKNYKVGDKVPLAQAGAVMPGDFKIKVGKLRGVESQGMMCSAKELGLSADADGLLILDPGSTIGTPLKDLYHGDTVLDLEITPNRADLLSHEGIAREVAALTGRVSKLTQVFTPETASGEPVAVETSACSFYSARALENVQVGPSPEWLKSRLESLGLRSINNVVDVTNWVMLESGHPLHAFDADKLQGALRVRFAKEGESLHALDGKTYQLGTGDVVIADESGPVAIAGVMGGEATGVTEVTKRVVLESAAFESSVIRRTSRGLGLSSDSSYRFERGVDVAGVLRASQRASTLLTEVASAQAGALSIGSGSDSVDTGALLQGLTPVSHVPLRLERVTALLGAPVPEARINQILSALGLSQDGAGWDVPSFRGDLTREIDLIEEIARVVGIEHFPPTTRARFSPSSDTDRRYDRLMKLRRAAVGQGLFEARSLTLVSEAMAQSPFVKGAVLRVKNPLNEDQVVLRPSLVPGLLVAAGKNARGGVKAIRLFETGRVFFAEGTEERTHVALVVSGPAWTPSWRCASAPEVDLFDLKGILSAVVGREVQFAPAPATGTLGIEVNVLVDGKVIGVAGQLRPSVAKEMDVQGSLLAAEVSLEGILGTAEGAALYKELPRFPAVTRDIAFVAPKELPHQRILEVLGAANEALLTGVELFDVFTDATGEKVGIGQKSVAYSLTYRSSERTLTADEVTAVHNNLKQRIISELGVVTRE